MSGLPYQLTRVRDIEAHARKEARAAGLTAKAARALAERVALRIVLGGESLDIALADELGKAVAS